MMTKGKVCFLLLEFLSQLRTTPRPWTFKRAHVNDFFELGNARSWEDHDQLEWTLIVGATQVTLACFMLEREADPSSDDDQYFVLAYDEDEEEEENDDQILELR